MLATDRFGEIAQAFRVLSDPMRLQILGQVAGQSRTGVELAAQFGLSLAQISHHLGRLEKVGLVLATIDGTGTRFALNAPFFDPRTLASGMAVEAENPPALETDAARERSRALKHFFEGRQLKSIPANRGQLIIVIQELLGWFEPDRDYPEREVNALLREAHEDVATLRRELIDHGFMQRAHGIYRVATVLPERGD